ncbi:leucine rich repeat containing 59 [Phyllostomus discolor]|uniref:Leucine-rich repeat-containing protein 59 n=1 Tax=Phyllostomus discolor TaxID=89673 RepID=A0A834DWH2_9CHIR|nr:leucine rich repeat containing 59 [Phyllostomus discolor]
MTKAGSKGGNLRDKLDGNELDLSLSDLNEVPVKELATLPKATVLDLSCNKLTTLPSDFCSLTYLVKLDLSKNKLQQLPADFGRLVNLQHLDLLNNRLVTLPVSFAQLKSLKWLDLKDNPLDPVLAKVAGDCLDEKQCKQCASKVSAEPPVSPSRPLLPSLIFPLKAPSLRVDESARVSVVCVCHGPGKQRDLVSMFTLQVV